MTYVFPRETRDWRPGDRAYCVNPVPPLERGRVYTIASARPVRAVMCMGLTLEGIDPPLPYAGYYSNRFIRLRPGESALRQIDAATEWGSAHYWRRGG